MSILSLNADDIVARFANYSPRPHDFCGDHALNDGLEAGKVHREAAVLVPLVQREDGLRVLFTKRTDHLNHHPGQISFPGGHIEDDDKTPDHAALRETWEEVGLHSRHIKIIGRLNDYITRTGFRVTPVVSLVTPPFDIKPDPFEVAEVFEVPLDFLLDKQNHQKCSRVFKGTTRYFWAMPYGEYYIWGATAGMLRNFYEFLAGKKAA